MRNWGVRLAAFEVVRWSIRLDLDGIVQSLVDPQARNGDHAIFYLADAAQVLLAYMRRGFPVLAVPGLASTTSAPPAVGAVLGSSSMICTLRRFISSGLQFDSERNH